MGCGSSINQVHDTNNYKQKQGAKLDLYQKFKIDKQWNEPYSLGKCYFFGQTAVEKKVVSYDVAHHSFHTISSRVRIPVPKIKLEPIQIFYEQSQQVILPDLFTQLPKPPFNQMFGTFFKNDAIFLCGGVTYERNEVTDESYFYRLSVQKSEKSSKNNQNRYAKFQRTQPLITARYRHMGVFKMNEKQGFIYVFGGLNAKHEALASCEKFNINEKKWVQLQPMMFPRSQGFSFVFMNKIYVLGGISAEKFHPKVIEVLDPSNDTWSKLEIKIHRGIRSGILITPKPNQILVLGGRDNQQQHKSIIRYNLLKQTYIWQSDAPSKLSNCKSAIDKDRVIIFGIGKQNIIKQYNTQSKKWVSMNYGFKNYIPIIDIQRFTCISEPLKVSLEQLKIQQENSNHILQANQTYIFGNDNYPVICKLTYLQEERKFIYAVQEVPMIVRLASMMSAVETDNGIIILGGSHAKKRKGESSCFQFNPSLQKSRELNRLNNGRYNVSTQYVGNKVYAIGGINNQIQKFNVNKIQTQISQVIQIYNTTTNQWSKGPKITRLRDKPQTFIFGPEKNRKILIFHGRQIDNSFSSLFQIYDIQSNQIVAKQEIKQFSNQSYQQFYLQEIQFNNQNYKTNKQPMVKPPEIKVNLIQIQPIRQKFETVKPEQQLEQKHIEKQQKLLDKKQADNKEQQKIYENNANNIDKQHKQNGEEQFQYVMNDNNSKQEIFDKINIQDENNYCICMTIFGYDSAQPEDSAINSIKTIHILINKADYTMKIKELTQQQQKLNIQIKNYQQFFTLANGINCFLDHEDIYVVKNVRGEQNKVKWTVDKLPLINSNKQKSQYDKLFHNIKDIYLLTVLSRK